MRKYFNFEHNELHILESFGFLFWNSGRRSKSGRLVATSAALLDMTCNSKAAYYNGNLELLDCASIYQVATWCGRSLCCLSAAISLKWKNVFPLQFSYSHKYPLLSDPSQQDIFEFADLVQLMSAVFCLIFSIVSSRVRSERANPIPFWEIVLMGALFTLNVNTLNYSLYYIPYPVRVVGDKLGYLTAVVVAVFFTRLSKNRKTKLGPDKMWRALLITVGAMGFAYFYKFKESQ